MSYARVEDVPASWDRYEAVAQFLRPSPDGLVLHVAGPTDEGFRIIEVWESEDAWRLFGDRLESAIRSIDPDVGPRTVVRHLRANHLVIGAAAGNRREHEP